ncbi:uncharacterized protein LOC128248504 [Octopus bimaculoides]|uniref:uncharacterized protein LOC128248504 n=1 Tax=Octopus bimaculoides TaxID=37653 RepID=UPI0022DF3DE7|nr:uncharacterized protein LOC128248504 [Octopus bimaculoides]
MRYNDNIVPVFLMEIVKREFDELNESFPKYMFDIKHGKSINKCKAKSRLIAEISQKHRILCKLLELCSDKFQLQLATIIFYVPCGIFCTLYGTLNKLLKYDEISFMLSFLLGSTCAMLKYFHEGILLYNKSHGILQEIYKSNIGDITPEAKMELTFFINRLSNARIGLCIGKFFLVNHSSVLGIFGTVVSYAILAYQTSSTYSSTIQRKHAASALNFTMKFLNRTLHKRFF